MKLKKQHIFWLMMTYIIAGSFNTIFLRLQNFEISLGFEFEHTWFVTQLMFIGEFYCLLLYIIIKIIKPKFNTTEEKNLHGDVKQRPRFWVYLGPAILELFSITSSLFALLNLPVIEFAMLKAGKLLFKAILARLLMGHRLHRHHYIGMVVVIIGMTTIGVSKMLKPHTGEERPRNEMFGYIALVLYFIFSSFQFMHEEYIMGKYKAHPLEVVGYQGFLGSLICLAFLIGFSNISCGDNIEYIRDFCSIDSNGVYKLETPIFAIQQMFSNLNIILLQLGYMIAICIENVIGSSITKFETSMERSISDTLVPGLVWVFFLVVPTKNKEKFNYLQLIGLIISTIGAFIYCELIELPCCRLNHNTRFTKSVRALESERLEDMKKEMLSVALGMR